MPHVRRLPQFVCLLLGWVACAYLLPNSGASAACLLEASTNGNAGPFIVHLAPDCTPAEREAHAVSSASVMDALAHGQPIDLVGVLLRGDLLFDGLAVQTTQLPKGLSPEQEAALRKLNAEEVRVIAAPVTLRNSTVLGALRHRSAEGTLQFEGPVDFHGTTFQRGVDLSRAVFEQSLDLSAAQFQQEVYFVQGQFAHVLNCKETKFGPHTRFHRSIFRGPLTCTGAIFDGMAEFLEVTFEQPVTMAGVRFGAGTGFSGSRFSRHVNFGEAIFSREAFFSFARFDGDVSFAGAQFLGSADFSDAHFKGPDDLMKARFDQPPLLIRTTRVTTPDQATDWLHTPTGQYGVTLFFLLMAALLVAYAFKIK
jgi:uncharacterized protein YjbI with pentapeptide repeats